MKMNRNTKIVILAVALIIIIILTFSVFEFYGTTILKQGKATVVESNFTFSNPAAIRFFQNLSTPTGLLREYVNSNTIYLSDDQQLDYAALMKLGDVSLADKINSTMQVVLGGRYGAFSSTECSYGNWNGVDVVLGMYMQIPCDQNFTWNTHSGFVVPAGSSNRNLPNSTGYVVEETLWGGQMGSDYTQYADLDLYYCLNQLHYGNYVDAVKAFENVNSMWDGHGFADMAYQTSSPKEYTSYKLALDLIAFKALMNNSYTEGSIVSYTSAINQVQTVMSKLQGSDGGVITNYEIVNGQPVVPAGTFENGETTSLFVLAE